MLMTSASPSWPSHRASSNATSTIRSRCAQQRTNCATALPPRIMHVRACRVMAFTRCGSKKRTRNCTCVLRWSPSCSMSRIVAWSQWLWTKPPSPSPSSISRLPCGYKGGRRGRSPCSGVGCARTSDAGCWGLTRRLSISQERALLGPATGQGTVRVLERFGSELFLCIFCVDCTMAGSL